MRDPVAPKDIEPTLYVFQFFQNGVEAILEGIRLEELYSRGSAEEKPGRASADERLQQRCQVFA